MNSDNALSNNQPDRYPLTPMLLAMIKAMQSAKALFIQEMIMFEGLELPKMVDWQDRCETLFESDYQLISNHMGLVQNRQVLHALLNVVLTSEINETPGNMLPKMYIFDAWGNNDLGAIVETCTEGKLS